MYMYVCLQTRLHTANRSPYDVPCVPSLPHTPPPIACGRRNDGGRERGGTAMRPQQQVTAKLRSFLAELQSFPASTSVMGQPQPTWCAPHTQLAPHTAAVCPGQTQ